MPDFRSWAFLLFVVLGAGSLTGCRLWPWQPAIDSPPAPVVFSGPPTLEELVNAVNANSAPVRQLQAETATVSLPGFPSLKANLYLERPRNFRLRAQLFGPELDVGSNADQFWFWAKQDPRPAIYYARHDQFAQSSLRQQLPIDPVWAMEALGLVSIDPSLPVDGPFPAGQERAEIRVRVPSIEGELTKVYQIHTRLGWILEQHLVGPQGQLLASARASSHRYYPNEHVSLPQQVEITVPSAQLRLTVQISRYQINGINGDPNQLWNLPTIPGYQAVNLEQVPPVASQKRNWTNPVIPYERTSQAPRQSVRGLTR